MQHIDYPRTETGNTGVSQAYGRSSAKSARKSKWGIGFIVIFIAVLLMLGVLFLFFNHFYSKLNVVDLGEKVQSGSVGRPGEQAFDSGGADSDGALQNGLFNTSGLDFQDKDVKNILIVGVDNDNIEYMESLGNADGIIILSINSRTKQIVLTSLMRDIYVQIPDMYKTKITLSYHEGGTSMLIDTIEANFGIPIDNYILVNYLNVIDIVDALGGVTMDVTAEELYFMEPKINNLNTMLKRPYSEDVIPPSQAGSINLNGVQTAAYLRIRYAGNADFDRTARARSVALALMDKADDLNLVQLSKLADIVLPCITTDFSQTDILKLTLMVPSYLKYDTVSSRIPVDGSFSLQDIGGSMVVIDFDVNRQHLYDTIYQGSQDK